MCRRWTRSAAGRRSCSPPPPGIGWRRGPARPAGAGLSDRTAPSRRHTASHWCPRRTCPLTLPRAVVHLTPEMGIVVLLLLILLAAMGVLGFVLKLAVAVALGVVLGVV